MVLRAKCVFLLAVFLATNAALVAQDRDAVLAKLNSTKAFLVKQRATPDYRESLRKSVLAYESTLETHCKNVELDFDSDKVRDRILALLEVDDKGVAVSGAWRESVPGTACNEKRIYNIQVDVTRLGQTFTPTFPGEAAGNPELQSDTLKNIEANFQILRIPIKKSCHLTVVDTHLAGDASAVLPSGIMSPWKESWSIQTCGKVYTVPVTYTPDDRGTAISIGTSDIQPH